MRIAEPGGRHLEIGGRTRLMGVLNVTPDSFSDGGSFGGDVARAVEHGVRLVAAGADVVDVGGESTRPGHRRVPADEQLRRVLPVVERLASRVAVPISIDTTSGAVARACLDAGACWVNDTSALADDPELGPLVARRRCPIVLMHRFDPPREPGDPVHGRALVEQIARGLARRVAVARGLGIARGQIVLDPGIGFGTLPEDNLAIHAHLAPLEALGQPLLLGPSRKSFLGHLTGRGAGERVHATAASVAALVLAGVHIVRVHDVAEMRDVVLVADAIRRARGADTAEVGR